MLKSDDIIINNVFDDQKLNVSLLPIHIYNDTVNEPIFGKICHYTIIVLFGFIMLITMIIIIVFSNK